jgi:hypothetical protein
MSALRVAIGCGSGAQTSALGTVVDAAELQPQPVRRLIRDQRAEDDPRDGDRKGAVERAL